MELICNTRGRPSAEGDGGAGAEKEPGALGRLH